MKAVQQQVRCLAVLVAFVLVVLPRAAWAQSLSPDLGGEGTGPVNTMCPVTTDEPIDARFTTEYNGTTIGLCCRKCLTKFESDPTAYLANIAGLSTVALDGHTGHENAGGQEDQHADHDHEPPVEEDAGHNDGESHPHPEDVSMSSSPSNDDEHDHATDHDSGSKLAAWVGKLHPPATHLPIGLLIGAAIAEGLLIFTRRDLFRHASAFCVVLAAIGGVTAATLGWFNGGFVLVDDDWVQMTHRWLGTGTAVLTLLSGVLLLRASRSSTEPVSRRAFRVSLFVTATLVGATGFFGGALVYGIDHYAW